MANMVKEMDMSYQVADKVNGFGGVFQTEADARALVEETIAEGIENETNWLMELARAAAGGGSVNIDDDGYVRRILSAAADDKRGVAMECARERMYADLTVVVSAEERRPH